MPQKEVTNNRPDNYSKWHREKLPSHCYNTDGDWFEQRIHNNELKVVAYIETVQIPCSGNPIDYPIWKSKEALANQINREIGIPAYFVWHTPNCKVFYIQNVRTDKIVELTEDEYMRFIKNLKVDNL